MFFCLFTFFPAANAFDNVVIFGDSLSDVGDNTWGDATDNGQGTNYKGRIGGPFTNFNPKDNHQDIWADYLAIKEFPHHYRVYPASEAPIVNPYTENVSYAYGGADRGDYYLSMPPLLTTTAVTNPVTRGC